jgi:UDP-N-acetyl-2-amino-2-deoxyglucuronate dehydrogenase
MKNFAVVGVGGYIAPRHLEAIIKTGNRIVAALDPNDSVGILDRYAPDAHFFTSPEKFEEYLQDVKGTENQIHYVSICSPNYLHSSHIKMAFRHGADAICEKPIVLTLSEIEELKELQKKTGQKVSTILQLRVHEAIRALKAKIDSEADKVHDIELTYITTRGHWYHESWKGDEKKSGGLTTNIGVHFFDMITWIFGNPVENQVHKRTDTYTAGFLKLEKANVKWFLTIDKNFLPPEAGTKTTYRSLKINGEEFEFSEGFTDLHTTVYASILNGMGYGLSDVSPAIKIVEEIREMDEIGGAIETIHSNVLSL